ncbi:hypothetical protein IU433_02685 [Nocardia puris]|uniref:Uncharacterized protein n=1 Tax=Nocardia puris TaxID=208602 RepID=A0A366DVI6_9NOCA|nr:hypothetical protein [Nocardia puris]MBF6210141.1 hypothetical protein [Nocardia puris]MBF6368332.1 hypothetical protein [Nocardia puris]MBF6457950.1 hypothetical protein [Nocardia puris]RBO94110.1 hypothetical protein DFR74_102532 [Nocardia puris]
MAITTTDWFMISDLTPESAYRERGPGERVWRLSWLPGRLLTCEEALAGMELDEKLSDPGLVHDRVAMAEAAVRADRLGILVEQAIVWLYKRMLERDGRGVASPQPRTALGCEHHSRRLICDEPHVYG